MINLLNKYIPKEALYKVEKLWNKYNFNLKIVPHRTTKLGDFKVLAKGYFQITVNCDLSPEQFLLTLVHEIAHLVTYQKHQSSVKPHGIEWQRNFKELMHPFLSEKIYTREMLLHLNKYLINPKASSCTDIELYNILNRINYTNKITVFSLQTNQVFSLKQRKFKLLKKRRTRAICLDLDTNKKYLVKGGVVIDV